MSTLWKLLGFRLGKREKSILLLMRAGDALRGKSVPVWVDICRVFEIEFGSLSKKHQPEEFCEENKYKCALSRLVRVCLIKPDVKVREDFSLLDPRGHGYDYYRLTELGCLVVEALWLRECQRVLLLRAKEDLEKVLCQFRGLGCVEVTLDQLLEGLWELSGEGFGDRIEFDRFWSNTKIGVMLQNCGGVERSRVSRRNRRRKYRLT
ncbi:MAG: hypothetical protein LBI79_06115 [Nitrososphaerota archaeon]|jgi:hypothetical protein|nr:hypothetical protein [Nitrososphaerota archaeon]